jgi:hypothetical protein
MDVSNRGNRNCEPRIFALAHKTSSNDILEFLILSDTQDGVYVELYAYSKKANRILSYLPIFNGEKLDTSECEPFGINLVSSYQTPEINNGVIIQEVNDGFNKPWVRKLRLNDDGYYELLWNNNPARLTTIYKAVIDDPDGYTNVRKLPTSNSPILYKIEENEHFTVEEYVKTSSWVKIFDYNGQFEGWIHKSRVKKISNK